MRICIGGKNNIAVDICSHVLENYPDVDLYVIPNKTDTGVDGSQRSLKKYAENNNVPIVSLSDIYSWEDLVFLSLEFDRIIRPESFKSRELFNIHFSLLPKYKGCHTAAMPILNGDEIGGVTFHLMEKGIDTGDIIDQEKVLIASDETCRSLYYKYLRLGCAVVKRNLGDIIERAYKALPQSADNSTYYSRSDIDYENIQIDYNRTASQVERQFRAYTFRDFQLPQFNGMPISYVEMTKLKSTEKPGSVVENDSDNIRISTIDYDVILHRDRLSDYMSIVENGDLEQLKSIADIRRYISEQEPIHGWTLLMIAAYHNNLEVAEYLIRMGSDINAQNYKGTTVIMYAKDGMFQTGDDRLFNLLLTKGANPYIKDYSGKNLFHYIDNAVKYKMIMNVPFNSCDDNKSLVMGGVKIE